MYDFTGTIIKVTPISSIPKGKFKEKCTFVVQDSKSRSIAFTLFDDQIYTLLKPLEIGDKVAISFTVKSVYLNNNWVTNCYVLSMTKVQERKNKKEESSYNDYKSYNSYNYRTSQKSENQYFPHGISKDEAKKIYRNLCKQYHPDLPGGSIEKMQEINKAYEKFK